MHVEYDGERCRWSLTDQGKGFDVEQMLTPTTPPEPEAMRCSGRGILLMRSFSTICIMK